MDERLRQAVQDHLEDGQLACQQAHAIAEELDIEPLEVGRAADKMGVRIFRCQLGLFGYGSKADGTHKIVRPMAQVPPHLEAALRAETGEAGLPCSAIWRVADNLGIGRLEASSAVESLGLRVWYCQLGCFPHPYPEMNLNKKAISGALSVSG
ncbi:MAG: hypothetical protein JXM73_01015 [Anaerolineae bacterium]|nr:hypothetical protein [Anaerolineae bacterium]